MTFDDVVHRLESSCGNHVEITLSLSPSGDEGRAIVAQFEGNLEDVRKSLFRADEFDAFVRLNSEHKASRGHVKLSRTSFQRAEGEDIDPTTLHVWQRGVKISFDLYG